MTTAREQKLIDLCFELAIKSADGMAGRSKEDIAQWVAGTLAGCGFKTRPIGLSLGILEVEVRPQPTVEELEKILQEQDDRPVTIHADGSITVHDALPTAR